jgi:hypothetical protein
MQTLPSSRFPTLAAVALVLGLTGLAPASFAADTAMQSAAPVMPTHGLSASATYKEVDLKKLVSDSRTEVPGQRIIFAPTAIKFRATLAALPAPQKADYLMTALSMMKVSNPPLVSQRIGLDYGGDKALAAYIEDGVAARLGKDVLPGQARTFYAFHVYNHSRGPALLVTSFSD